MKRPTRIMVFGVLCLVMGALSGLNNISELATAAMGPAALEDAANSGIGGALGEMMQQSTQALLSALHKPGYRLTLGVESLIGGVMATLLIVAGIGLMRDQIWALKLAKLWAWYALFASVLTVVMQAKFVMPEMDPSVAPPGSAMLGVACMLPFLWAFPICVLTVLSRPAVMNYLRWRAGQGATVIAPIAEPSMNTPQDHSGPVGSDSPPPPDPRPTETTRTPQADQRWRDDPWNDTNSQ